MIVQGNAEISTWAHCYDDSWNGLIVDEAFAHPAKFAYGLITRIVEHGLAHEYWRAGDVIGDSFGGIGTGGIVCAANGMRWVGIELESRFVELAKRNFALNPWCRNGEATIIQGDSRDFASLVGECAAVVTSAPYAESMHDGESRQTELARMQAAGHNEAIAKASRNGKFVGDSNRGYGVTDGQVGALREGRLDSVITSPPFGASTADRPSDSVRERLGHTMGRSVLGDVAYGDSGGQVGNTTGDTYWSAVATIYDQCRLALKPGGVLCCVMGNYVKAGKIVDLCGQTWTLLQHLGFEPLERIRALKTTTTEHASLFDSPIRRTKSRVSFFRRLAIQKGSPDPGGEEVLFLRKPA